MALGLINIHIKLTTKFLKFIFNPFQRVLALSKELEFFAYLRLSLY
jgi:hypothetical protein